LTPLIRDDCRLKTADQAAIGEPAAPLQCAVLKLADMKGAVETSVWLIGGGYPMSKLTAWCLAEGSAVYSTRRGGVMKISAISCAVLVVVSLTTVPSFASQCDGLATLALKDATITRVQLVAAGKFSPPGEQQPTGARVTSYKDLPEFCRVAATLTPTSDSDIKVEVWLPANGWNGKFQAVGNGGWAGVISYSAMADAVRAGYASASTDTGHVGGRGTFALGHPEKLVDFAWRSEHEMTVKAKAVIQAFYGSAPKLSYWNGCSTGGRQGLKEAQKFPDDYDGIIAGAPANRTAISLWIAHAVLKDPASYIQPDKYPLIHQAALAACDAVDGLKDGLIDDPTKCSFDPKVLLCKDADTPSCLTAPQVTAAKKIYSPAINPRTGQQLFSSLVPGTELGWGVQALGPDPSANIYDQYRYVVFKDPNWDWKTFNFDSDVERGNLPENLIMNATDPNMKPFFSHGGKLLLYHGWSDPNVPALNTIKYFNSVVENLGGASKAASSVRLFLEPGMGHCGGGEGPNVFDKVGALERWVEQGKTPDALIASHSTDGKVDRTRPLCPYPQVATYKGTGSIDDAANFVCAAP
jgi:Tannase and feruloyl esterase